MIHAIRGQADYDELDVSEATALDLSDEVDMTRQEYRDEADINVMLHRYGVNTPTRPPNYGEVDYTMDLQQAMIAVENAKIAHRQLPVELRQKYPTWREMLNATESGRLRMDLDQIEDERQRKEAADRKAALEQETKVTPA